MVRSALIAILCLVTLATGAHAYETQRVVIVVIDGPRDREVLEHPTHAYIPRIWNELRPAGYVSNTFHNPWKTKTVPAHAGIATGVYLDIDPNGDERPSRPTLWEYLRHQTGLPDHKTVLVLYKDKLRKLSYSADSAYGAQDSAFVIGPLWSDTLCVRRFIDFAGQNEPVVSMLALGHVDVMAHGCDAFVWYTNAIRAADDLIAQLWDWLQSQSGYAGRTALIITADHGRHDDDWCSHGDGCEGCRHLPFVALGPDFRAGVEDFEHVADQRDICATLCELLGVPAPSCEGRVMTEMLRPPADAENDRTELCLSRFRLTTPALDYAHLRLIVPRDDFAGDRFSLALFDVMGRPLWVADLSAEEFAAGWRLERPARAMGSGVTWLRIRRAADSRVAAISTPILWIQ